VSETPVYLVTGASGFLGRHLLTVLHAERPEFRPVALARNAERWRDLGWPDDLGEIAVVEGDVAEAASWRDDPSIARLDGVFHLAGQVRHSRSGTEAMWRCNVDGTLDVVRLAAERGCRVVFVSSTGAVGASTDRTAQPDEDAPLAENSLRQWPYYHSKAVAEREARALAGELGVELVVIRPPVLLGPGDHGFRSTGNVIRLLRKRLPFMLEGGMHFVDVRDVALAVLRAMEVPHPRPVYHLPGTACALEDFFRECADVAGMRPNWARLPGGLLHALAMANEKVGAPLSLLPDPVVIEMARHYWDAGSRYSAEDLGFTNRPPRETLEDTIGWLRAHHPDLAEA
jgi:dihydroflavonol-4-reductase